jgi:hypothetical protein
MFALGKAGSVPDCQVEHINGHFVHNMEYHTETSQNRRQSKVQPWAGCANIVARSERNAYTHTLPLFPSYDSDYQFSLTRVNLSLLHRNFYIEVLGLTGAQSFSPYSWACEEITISSRIIDRVSQPQPSLTPGFS